MNTEDVEYLRSLAINTVLEATHIAGRDRMTPDDAKRSDTIHRVLVTTVDPDYYTKAAVATAVAQPSAETYPPKAPEAPKT